MCSNYEMDLHFWNTDRLSACDAKARRRFVRVMGFGASGNPDAIGLSEVSNTALKHLDRFANDHGYRLIHRSPDSLRFHVALMISNEYRIVSREVFTHIDAHIPNAYSEVSIAAIEDSACSVFSIATVYNSYPWSKVFADAQDFADRHSEGRFVIGGDFNIARMLDGDRTLWAFGSEAFERINCRLGWIEAFPGEADDEVPTWPVGPSAGNKPRQLDHVFVNGLSDLAVDCSVVIPPEEDIRLSDHALLRARLSPLRAKAPRGTLRSVFSAQ